MAKVVFSLSFFVYMATASIISQPAIPNFFAQDVLDDGQIERRFFLNGIALKETAAVYTLNGTK